MSKIILITILFTHCIISSYSQFPGSIKNFHKHFLCKQSNLLIWETNNKLSSSSNDGKELKTIQTDSEILDVVLFKEGLSDKLVIVLRSKLLFSLTCGKDFTDAKITNTSTISFKFNKYSADMGLALVASDNSFNDLYLTRDFGGSWSKVHSYIYSYFW
jgi:hypothetical protein